MAEDKDWKIELCCDACDCPKKVNCALPCITLFAPCVTVGEIAKITKTNSFFVGMVKSLIPIYNCLYFWELRNKVATNSGIKTENATDYGPLCLCCPWCAIVQTGHEAGAFAMGEVIERQ